MKGLARRALAVVLLGGALTLAIPTAASAHPLGNFTVNRYSGLVVAPDSVTVAHVVDFAEIPTAQRKADIDADGDGSLTGGELSAWAARQCAATLGTLELTVAGHRTPLEVDRSAATTRGGQAGLPILRLECTLRASVSVTRATDVAYVDTAATEQVGWREVTAQGDGVTLTNSDVPRHSPSRVLTAYPKDLLSSPLDVRGARLEARPGGPRLRALSAPVAGVASVVGGVTGPFQGLATAYDGSLLVGLVAVLAALALGAMHAVAPGHGKTIMAFYLSGRRDGAVRAAATVGATVTATHTAGVLALGVLVSTGTAFVPARIYPWLTLLSGALVVAVGLTLLREARRGGHIHTPGSHTRHGHSHDHGRELVSVVPEHSHQLVSVVPGHSHTSAVHSHGHAGHSHTPTGHSDDHHGTAPAGQRSLVAMGLAGGLLPSPSAVLVFLGALAVGHPWFGVLLVVAFGLGMATTLSVVGLLVTRLRHLVERRLTSRGTRAGAALSRLPVVTAVAVIGLGALLATKGVGAIGG